MHAATLAKCQARLLMSRSLGLTWASGSVAEVTGALLRLKKHCSTIGCTALAASPKSEASVGTVLQARMS